MKLLNYEDFDSVSEGISYHIENDLSISESIYRIGSDSYLALINEMRSLYNQGKLTVCEDDQFILEKLQTGKKGIYKDSKTKKEIKVTLDDPQLAPKSIKNLYYVYRASPSGKKINGLPQAIIIGFGERNNPDVRTKHQDPGKRAGFLARQRCSDKKDPYKSGWWSCNIHKFWKQLGLSSNDPW